MSLNGYNNLTLSWTKKRQRLWIHAGPMMSHRALYRHLAVNKINVSKMPNTFNPSTPAVAIWVSIRVSRCQKLQMTA